MGRTQGRDRQDRFRKAGETVKDIYMYRLAKDFCPGMGLASEAGFGALKLAEGLSSADWAEKEFKDAPLGEVRLSYRLVEIAGLKAENPGHAFTGVAGGDWTSVKGYYRLIDKPDWTKA